MNPPTEPAMWTRRRTLRQTSVGFGSLALSALLQEETQAKRRTRKPHGITDAGDQPAERQPHFPARARRIIFLFMHGAPSHVDTFDYKPLLIRDHGKPLPFAKPRITFAPTSKLLRPLWEFRRYGESGQWISDLFPHLGQLADEMCFIKSLNSDNVVHGNASLQLHTGSDVFVRPSMGAWITYGLGTENKNLPGFITISPTYMQGGTTNFGAAFLPPAHQGTPIGSDQVPVKNSSIRYLENRFLPRAVQRAQLDFVREMNQTRLDSLGDDSQLEARIQSFELAFRMQTEAGSLIDISGESETTHELYGINDPVTADFGQQCLLARRFCEKGVRFVQCSHSYKWDQHSNLRDGHQRNALEIDKPIAGLLTDLKSRGLLEDTLVLWGAEFGRTPTGQGGTDGRDHNPWGYTMWMAGGGVKGGTSYGDTDDYGFYAVRNKVHIHDLHATLLHLLGLDHEKLTYRHAGRDFRLTDVYGQVVTDIMG